MKTQDLDRPIRQPCVFSCLAGVQEIPVGLRPSEGWESGGGQAGTGCKLEVGSERFPLRERRRAYAPVAELLPAPGMRGTHGSNENAKFSDSRLQGFAEVARSEVRRRACIASTMWPALRNKAARKQATRQRKTASRLRRPIGSRMNSPLRQGSRQRHPSSTSNQGSTMPIQVVRQ